MKPRIVLKSLDDLSPNVLEPEPDRAAQASPKPAALPILLPAYSGFAGYQHWGINE